MRTKYCDVLNEAFDRMMLNEAQQVVIDFKNDFGEEIFNRFQAQKQRMQGQERDISYWVGRFNNFGERVVNELDALLTSYEQRKTRSQRNREAEAGAEVIYEDDRWLVLHITTYEAAAKYGSHTRWCITGRYEGNEDRGQYFFDRYLNNNYTGYYFFIRKGNDEEKYAVCPLKDGDGYDIWDPKDGRPSFVPNGPTGVPGLEDVPVREFDWDYSLANESDEDDTEAGWEDEEVEDTPEDWEDENGHVWHGHRPGSVREVDMIDVTGDPEEFEFPANSRDEAIRKFAEKGFRDAHFVEEIPGTPLCIVKFMVDEEVEEFDDITDDNGEIYRRTIPGDRYTAFVFIPGQGGGPLLTPPPQSKIVAHKTIDALRSEFGGDRFRADQMHRQSDPVEDPRGQNEEEMDESFEIIHENYFYFDYKLDEGCCKKLNEDAKYWFIMVGDEDILDIEGSQMQFDTEEDAIKYAEEELELLPGDYDVLPKMSRY